MHPGIRTGATEMSEANPSDVKSRANETFGEMYARFEREAWAGGGYVSSAAVMIICSVRLLAALAVRLVSRLVRLRIKSA